jgi:hypothetical protein
MRVRERLYFSEHERIGTGKTDYKVLRALIEKQPPAKF